MESTTLTKVFEEDANRCLILQTDEKKSQTKLIMLNTARQASSTNDDHEQRDRTRQVWRTMQLLLDRKEVTIPYAEQLPRHFPHDRLESRRAFPQLLSVIKASALLHQFQRHEDNGKIVARGHKYLTLVYQIDAGRRPRPHRGETERLLPDNPRQGDRRPAVRVHRHVASVHERRR